MKNKQNLHIHTIYADGQDTAEDLALMAIKRSYRVITSDCHDKSYILPMIVGKLISGICAVVLAFILYKDRPKKQS